MQYVQRLSQPSCTFIWTRVRDVNLALADAGKLVSFGVKGERRDGLSGCGSSSVGSMASDLSLPICCVYCVSSGNIGSVGRCAIIGELHCAEGRLYCALMASTREPLPLLPMTRSTPGRAATALGLSSA